ncbi:MAG: nickel pincer cofactor biosynthesis protein LarB [Lachnospiraceae bacterium]|nr:nickel pincer cofactor biosynthesis protein LarB [Lachnospiraceae bacterium]
MKHEMKQLLEQVQSGAISVDDALLAMKMEPYEDLGFAKIDLHRRIRNGAGEVIYGAGKTVEQMIAIVHKMLSSGQDRILITRLDDEKAKGLTDAVEMTYYPEGHIGIVGGMPPKSGNGTIVVATGGTSDVPVAEEAALTAEFLGNDVIRLYDVGVAGLHRTLAHLKEIMEAEVVIAIAGMEGALASVLGGLAECPVIAVPTSVGYGASFHGVSALLSMLNSCASGVSVVNIDNGFGAAYQASLINHAGKKG